MASASVHWEIPCSRRRRRISFPARSWLICGTLLVAASISSKKYAHLAIFAKYFVAKIRISNEINGFITNMFFRKNTESFSWVISLEIYHIETGRSVCLPSCRKHQRRLLKPFATRRTRQDHSGTLPSLHNFCTNSSQTFRFAQNLHTMRLAQNCTYFPADACPKIANNH